MSFLYPAFLLGAIAVALPIALHLLRRDVAPEVPFSAVRLLRKSPIDRTRRRRLRDLILLAARVTALALLAMAFARPYLTAASSPSALRIVAIDRSFSMGAPGRFRQALDLARAAVVEAGAGERVAVIAFDDRAEVVARPGSASDARSALDGLTAGFGATRFAPALAKATELAAGSPARVVLVSDLQRNGWEDEQPFPIASGLQVDLRDVGEPPANAAVVQVRVEPERLVATIRNTSSTPFSGIARVRVGGRDVATAAITVAAEESQDVPIAYRASAPGSLSVIVDDQKGYPADNIRHVVLDPPTATRVMVLTTAGAPQSGLYVARALEAAPSSEGRAFEVRMVSGSELSQTPADVAARYAAIVVLSTRGLDRRARDLLGGFLRAGGGVFVAAGADVEPAAISSAFGWTDFGAVEQSQNLTFSASDVRHPIFRPFGPFAANLGQVRFARTWKLRAPGWEVAARFTDGSPALVERQGGKGRAMIFASDVDKRWNEFPLHPAFVPFAAEAVRHVAGTREHGREYLVADAPAGSGPAPGVYTTKDGRAVAVNVDVRESAVARLTPREFNDMLVRPSDIASPRQMQESARARTMEAAQSLWQYGLVLMLAVLIIESAVGRA